MRRVATQDIVALLWLSALPLADLHASPQVEDPTRYSKRIGKGLHEAQKLIQKRRPGDVAKLPRTLGKIEDDLKCLAKIFGKLGNDKMERRMKKSAQLLAKLERGAAKNFAKLVPAFEAYRKEVIAFEKHAKKAEAEAFEPVDRMLKDLMASARRVSAGRGDPREALEQIDAWERRGEAALDDALDALAAQADEHFGPGAKDKKQLERLVRGARSGTGGTPEADVVVQALKSAVKPIEKELAALTDALRKGYADVLAGAKGHRQALARKKALDRLVRALRKAGQSSQGFAANRRAIEAGAERLAVRVRAGGAVRPRDLTPLRKQVASVTSACRKYRVSEPDWVDQAEANLDALARTAGAPVELEKGLTALDQDLRAFQAASRDGALEIERLLAGADSFAELEAAKRRSDQLEARFENEWKSLEREIAKVDRLAQKVVRVRAQKGPGAVLVDALRARATAIRAALDATESRIAADRHVEAVLEGYDGK